jgi:hypothetical protein
MSTIYSTPELGPPLPKPSTRAYGPADLTERVAAASATVHMLADMGMEIAPMAFKDETTVAAVMTAYASDPEATSRLSTNARIGTMTPASIRAIDRSLKEFSHVVVENSAQLRHYVTNKLIEETDNPDPRIRVRALELLGKISDVGLFADKTEVTVTHQTTNDLKESLREKLMKLVNPDVLDAEIIEDDALTPVTPEPKKQKKTKKVKPEGLAAAPKQPAQVSTEPVPEIDMDALLSEWGD